MLNSINLNDKTYEEMLLEAMAQIPLYSDEWTNLNVSDPGITMLENLTSFNALQQGYINEVTDEVRRKMLKMLGFNAAENKESRVYLHFDASEEVDLPIHYRLLEGEISFELNAPVSLSPWGIAAVYTQNEFDFRDITYLLDIDVPSVASVFGTEQKKGFAFCILFNGLPMQGKPLLLSVRIKEETKRNAFEAVTRPGFGSVEWQCYTADGWVKITVSDETFGFLKNGIVECTLSDITPVLFQELPVKGFALRCVLVEEDYDIIPKLHSIETNLFEVLQQQTRAASFMFKGDDKVFLSSELAQWGNIFVYCKEEQDGPYRAYNRHGMQTARGRFYYMIDELTIAFDKDGFGFGPCDAEDAIKVVCYDDEMVLHRNIGTVFGYENQILNVESVENIIPDSFQLIVKTRDSRGENAYEFVQPKTNSKDSLYYKVRSKSGEVVIKDSGLSDDCQLILADCAVMAGHYGNIRENNKFEHFDNKLGAVDRFYFNPAPGFGGESYESFEELRLRFIDELKKASRAVTAWDYEEIVRNTPGLCIHKVKAVTDDSNNTVKIAVRPDLGDTFSMLSTKYLNQIYSWIEPRRMITTKVEIIQPRYVPINVQATIYVKSYYENTYEKIEAMLKEELDYINSTHGFGETIKFNEIYEKLESMDCVDSVYKLILRPHIHSGARMKDADICLDSQCLCWLGRLDLEINSKSGL